MLKRIVVLITLLAVATALAAPARAAHPRPRLVVLISIDQFRADYLTRFSDLYVPPRDGDQVGGFRYLMERGAWYLDCQYEHHRTVTAAGHSILGTGAQPCFSGIVGNNWFDRKTGKSVYCVDDPKSRVVGAVTGSKETPMSAATQLVTTLGDELELATGGQARTVSLSLKDRAAILMTGHHSDSVVWFDEETGGWVSSTAYCKAGNLPGWAVESNARHPVDELRKTPWTPKVSLEAMRRVWPVDRRPTAFSHVLTGKNYVPFTVSPAGNEHVLETAQEAVTAERLGQDEIPDLLTINLASNDYVGHAYGPDSAEVLDISVQTDRQLADFFNFLARTVPGGLGAVTIGISADHGVVTIPELNTGAGVPAGRSMVATVRAAAQKALETAIGPAEWIASMDNGEIYLAEAALARYPGEPRSRLERIVADAVAQLPGVYACFGKSSVLSGQVPQSALGRRMTLGVHPTRSGDVILILDPQWLPASPTTLTGTSHGAPFTYDNHVPLLLAGAGIRRGVYGERVSPARIAPTLAFLVDVARPSAADEPLLPGLAGVER